MRDAADQCEQEVDALATELSLDRGVYDALAAHRPRRRRRRHEVLRAEDAARPAPRRRRQGRRRRARASPSCARSCSRSARSSARTSRTTCARCRLDPAELDGLPDDFKQQHKPGADGKVVISTDNTDYIPFVTYAKSGKAREALWRHLSPARPSQEPRGAVAHAREASRAGDAARLRELGRLRDRRQDDRLGARRRRVHRAHHRRLRGRAPRATTQQLLKRKQKDDPTREERVGLGLGVLPGARHGRGVRLRLAGDARLLRVRAREEGRARHHRRACSASSIARSPTRRCGTPRSTSTTSSRAASSGPHLPRHASARGQVQARRAVHAGQRRARARAARGRADLQLPAARAASRR